MSFTPSYSFFSLLVHRLLTFCRLVITFQVIWHLFVNWLAIFPLFFVIACYSRHIGAVFFSLQSRIHIRTLVLLQMHVLQKIFIHMWTWLYEVLNCPNAQCAFPVLILTRIFGVGWATDFWFFECWNKYSLYIIKEHCLGSFD